MTPRRRGVDHLGTGFQTSVKNGMNEYNLIYWSKSARTNKGFSKIKQFKKFDIGSCYFLKTVPVFR
jgi:hypothetical protein